MRLEVEVCNRGIIGRDADVDIVFAEFIVWHGCCFADEVGGGGGERMRRREGFREEFREGFSIRWW